MLSYVIVFIIGGFFGTLTLAFFVGANQNKWK